MVKCCSFLLPIFLFKLLTFLIFFSKTVGQQCTRNLIFWEPFHCPARQFLSWKVENDIPHSHIMKLSFSRMKIDRESPNESSPRQLRGARSEAYLTSKQQTNKVAIKKKLSLGKLLYCTLYTSRKMLLQCLSLLCGCFWEFLFKTWEFLVSLLK